MISFRPVTSADLALLGDWLARPHWRTWWGDPETELGYIRDMVEGRDTTEPFIFQIEGRDTGYIQVWYVKDQMKDDILKDYPWLTRLPSETVGVDLSIADDRQLSRGIGTKVLSAFVDTLRQRGFERIIIDPDPENQRAVKAYRKAGFREIPELLGQTDDSLLMEHKKTEGVS